MKKLSLLSLHCCKYYFAAWTMLFMISSLPLSAQTSFTGTYQQNFNSMGTGSTIPAGWSHIGTLGGSNSSWGTSIPASGSPSAASAGTVNNSLIVATNTFTGTSNTRAYNYSGSTTTDRALGTSPTTGAGNILQLRLTNNTGSSVAALQIGYDIRRFATASSAETMPGYRLFISLNNGSTWAEATSLRPTSSSLPNTNGTSNFSQVVNLASAVANGAEIRFRWVDDNSTGASPDQRIGLDNVTIVNSAPGACGIPSGLVASSLSSTGASLSWSSVAGATAYNLQWKATSAATFTTVSNLTTPSYSLSGLTASTNYTWQVQAVCGTTSSAYSAPSTFTTTATGGTPNEVIYIWSGAIQPTSATVVAKVTNASTTCRVLASTSSTLSNPVYSAFASASSSNNFMAKMNLTGLLPNTQYFYAVESNGVVDNSVEDIGQFKTPASGAFSFSFAHGSCSATGSHNVFTAIQNKSPLFFLETGDLHYSDPNSSNISTHRTPYENNILSQTASSNLFKNLAMAYMWDDHDYCGNNNSGSGQTGTANARQAYQEYVPHYPLVAGSGNVPIYQAFTIGRIRFILADLRSMRSGSSMFGQVQKDWFKQECINARNNCQVIAWVTGTSFGGNQSDNWGGFTAERTELCNFFRDNNIQNMFIMSGDAHLLAIDNGSNHDFSTGSNNPNDYPVFAGAGLNQSGSNKGGTYSQGAFPNPNSSTGQYGLVEVVDNGGSTISFNFKGYRTSGNSSADAIQVSYSFSRAICTPAIAPAVNQNVQFAIRPLFEGAENKLTWVAETGVETVDIHRTDSDGNSEVIAKGKNNIDEFTDKNPNTGWNYYHLINGKGEVIASKEVFVKGKSELKVFPNPAADIITISLPGCEDLKEGHLLIYNAAQVCVKTEDLLFDGAKNAAKLDVSMLPSGFYTILLQSNGMNISKPVIISR